MEIQSITDASFSKYGKILSGYDFTELLDAMKDVPYTEECTYVASASKLEELDVAVELQNQVYGGLPIQIGYCIANNHKLNGLEYHRSSEINIATVDMILLLGRQQDIDAEYHLDTAKVEAFLVPAGTGVEMYATTLHYVPCTVEGEEGIKSVVVLQKDTNMDIDFSYPKVGENQLLAGKNKWLLMHKEAMSEGEYEGLIGENITIY